MQQKKESTFTKWDQRITRIFTMVIVVFFTIVTITGAVYWGQTGHIDYLKAMGDLPPGFPLWGSKALSVFIRILPLFSIGFIVFTDEDSSHIWKESLFFFPSGMLVFYVTIIGLAFFAMGFDDVAIIARIATVLMCWIAVIASRSVRKELEVEEKAKEEEKPAPSTKEEEGKCGICKKDSLYPVCIACEKEYQGEMQRVRSQLHRAKKANVPATLTLAQWIATLKTFHWRCAYCQTRAYEVLEHYVPISNGGGTTAENCIPACIKCNSQKSNGDPGLF